MPGGIYRTISPDPEECIELGKDLVAFFLEPNQFRVLMGQWWSLKQGMLRSEWKTLIQRKEFVPYYEQTQLILATKCLDGTLKEGQGNRYLRLHDRELIEAENENAIFNANLNNKEKDDTAETIRAIAQALKDNK